MAFKAVIPLLILCVVFQALAESENNTAAAVTEKPTDNICKACKCSSGLIDCDNINLNQFFTVADWQGIKSENPREVRLTHNNFIEVKNFSELPLMFLDLSYGKIQKIQEGAFKNLQNMTKLDLSYNNISSEALTPNVFLGKYSPEQYEPLKSMRTLNLSYNNLHSLDQDLFEHIPELENLILKGNPFTMLDHSTVVAITDLSNLKVLDISACMLKTLPESLFHTPRYLKWLDISSNEFQRIPSSIEEVKSLQFLNISYNPIQYIERNASSFYTPFYSMPALVELDISHMPVLKAIRSRSMSGMMNLKILHMNFNPQLSQIDGDIFETEDQQNEGDSWPMIEELYLNKNNLSSINSGLIVRWDMVKNIDIRHNPYLCDCTTQWMVNILAPIVLNKSPDHASDIICQDPVEMRGRSIIHLEEIHSHMRCSDKYGDRPERDGLFLIGTLIGVLITLPVLLGILLLHKRGYFSFCGASGPAAFSRQFYKRADTNDFL